MQVNYSIKELKTSGVYCILYLPTGRRYVGSTTSFHKRLLWHRALLNKGTHDNKLLQQAWKELDPADFSFVILEEVEKNKDKLIEREQYWMDYYEVLDPEKGFNIGTAAINPMLGNTHTPEARAKISEKAKGRVVPDELKQRLSQKLKGVPKSSSRVCNSNRQPSRAPRKKPVNRYFLTGPDGTEYITDNLADFCRDNLLHRGHLSAALKGTGIYKGWKGYSVPLKSLQENVPTNSQSAG